VFQRDVEVETPNGNMTITMKCLKTKQLPKYWKLIRKYESPDSEPDEEMIELAVELIDASIKDSVPDDDLRDQIIVANFFKLLTELYELNTLGVKKEDVEKVQAMVQRMKDGGAGGNRTSIPDSGGKKESKD